ncbi:hypothetical protein L6452_31105 [Arctium lappa]|uniref:Uncharacterized protein n=1 Tax=Arctium lappa TaxID=4217 RepID=A0ACB8ZKF5_ARCLA|nr:hypothetical protein L6452_31105 [Arctium lappa]
MVTEINAMKRECNAEMGPNGTGRRRGRRWRNMSVVTVAVGGPGEEGEAGDSQKMMCRDFFYGGFPSANNAITITVTKPHCENIVFKTELFDRFR